MSKDTAKKQIDVLIEELQTLKTKVEKLELLMVKENKPLNLHGKIVTIHEDKTIIKANKVEEDV